MTTKKSQREPKLPWRWCTRSTYYSDMGTLIGFWVLDDGQYRMDVEDTRVSLTGVSGFSNRLSLLREGDPHKVIRYGFPKLRQQYRTGVGAYSHFISVVREKTYKDLVWAEEMMASPMQLLARKLETP